MTSLPWSMRSLKSISKQKLSSDVSGIFSGETIPSRWANGVGVVRIHLTGERNINLRSSDGKDATCDYVMLLERECRLKGRETDYCELASEIILEYYLIRHSLNIHIRDS